ncbi:hypothetical protein BH09ACT6_BH09ACT6_24050 [soil metagenome]
MTTRKSLVAGALAVLLGAMLVGCSQVAAIAPVGGNHQAEVRYAAIDVLMGAGIDFLTAPVCETSTDGAITCAGETTKGEHITALSPTTDQTRVTVTVGSDVLYTGSIMDVLDAAARSTS